MWLSGSYRTVHKQILEGTQAHTGHMHECRPEDRPQVRKKHLYWLAGKRP